MEIFLVFCAVWKISKYRVFSGSYLDIFSPNTGKYGPEKNPYLYTFHRLFPWIYCLLRERLFSNTFKMFPIKRRQVLGEIPPLWKKHSLTWSFAPLKRNPNQFVIFNPRKVPWNWIAFSQNSLVISPGLLSHLIKHVTGRLANKAFTSNPIIFLKQ